MYNKIYIIPGTIEAVWQRLTQGHSNILSGLSYHSALILVVVPITHEDRALSAHDRHTGHSAQH